MKKLIIADITTLTENNKLYGHFPKVAQEYNDILCNKFDCYISGGKTYSNYFDMCNYIKLPFYIKFNQNKSKIKKIFVKFKELINALCVLNIDSDIVIFQSYSELPIFLALYMKKKCNKKIYMIQYQKGLKSKITRRIYNKVRYKINGIITSSDEVGKFYSNNYIVIPDYFPRTDLSNNKDEKQKYDFTILGTISEGKDYENIINVLKNTGYRVRIAGKFFDRERYNLLKKSATKNIEFIDKYLTDEEYEKYIYETKYIVLPYKSQYENKSSGVVLDAIYRKKPVIASDLSSFKFIEKYELGLLYRNSFSEVLERIDEKKYKIFKENINRFVKEKEIEKDKLIEFIM